MIPEEVYRIAKNFVDTLPVFKEGVFEVNEIYAIECWTQTELPVTQFAVIYNKADISHWRLLKKTEVKIDPTKLFAALTSDY